MARRRVIPFLADNNLEDSIVRYLIKRGHDVVRVRDIMPHDSPDPVVAEAAMQAGRVLLTRDKDFHHQRFLKPRFRLLNRIGFSCEPQSSVKRIRTLITLIESEYRKTKLDKPMVIKIDDDRILIGR